MRRSVAYTVLVLGFTSVAWGAEAPATVSPGHASKLALIGDACPTFNWGAVPGAKSYEVVVYRLSEEREEAQPVLSQRIAGSALGWTPALAQCLERGGQYAWSVRAVGRKGAPDWSPPRLFEVASGPSDSEFQEAFAVVHAYLEAQGARTESWVRGSTSLEPIGVGEEALAPEASGASGGEPEPQALTTPDTTGLKSEVAATTGAVTFGIHGISNSQHNGSVGVVGQSTATTGNAVGVLGEAASPLGAAGEFHHLYPSGGDILRGFVQSLEVFSVEKMGEVHAGGDLYVGGLSSTNDDTIYFDTTQSEYLQWKDSPGEFVLSDDLDVEGKLFANSDLHLGGASNSDDDTIYFDTGTSESFKWDNADSQFEVSHWLAVNGGGLQVSFNQVAHVAYSRFGTGTATGGSMDSPGDVLVSNSLEVKGSTQLDGAVNYGCGSYSQANVCPVASSVSGPRCDRVPVGSFCDADSGSNVCSLSVSGAACGMRHWFVRTG